MGIQRQPVWGREGQRVGREANGKEENGGKLGELGRRFEGRKVSTRQTEEKRTKITFFTNLYSL